MVSPKKFREMQDQIAALEFTVKKQAQMLQELLDQQNNLTDTLVRKTLLNLHALEAKGIPLVDSLVIAAADASGELYEEEILP